MHGVNFKMENVLTKMSCAMGKRGLTQMRKTAINLI